MAAGPGRIENAMAFDHAASWLSAVEPPMLAVVSTPEFVDLLLDRATSGLDLACENQATRAHAEQRLRDGAVSPLVTRETRILPPLARRAAATTYNGAVWASPQPGAWRSTLTALMSQLGRGASLCIFTATAWDGLIRPFRVQSLPGEPASLARLVRTRLASEGWTISRSRSFGGVAGVGWAVANRFAMQVARTDLADRAEQAHHRAAETPHGASYELLLASRAS